jgi:hypothetical protein
VQAGDQEAIASWRVTMGTTDQTHVDAAQLAADLKQARANEGMTLQSVTQALGENLDSATKTLSDAGAHASEKLGQAFDAAAPTLQKISDTVYSAGAQAIWGDESAAAQQAAEAKGGLVTETSPTMAFFKSLYNENWSEDALKTLAATGQGIIDVGTSTAQSIADIPHGIAQLSTMSGDEVQALLKPITDIPGGLAELSTMNADELKGAVSQTLVDGLEATGHHDLAQGVQNGTVDVTTALLKAGDSAINDMKHWTSSQVDMARDNPDQFRQVWGHRSGTLVGQILLAEAMGGGGGGAAGEGAAAETGVARGALAEGTAAEGTVARGALAEGTATEGAVSRGALSEGTSAEGAAARGSAGEGAGTLERPPASEAPTQRYGPGEQPGGTEAPTQRYGPGEQPGGTEAPTQRYGPGEQPGGTEAPTQAYGPGERPTQPYGSGDAPTQPYGPGEAPTQPYGPGEAPTQPYGPGDAPTQQYGPGERPTQPYPAGETPGAPQASEPLAPPKLPDTPHPVPSEAPTQRFPSSEPSGPGRTDMPRADGVEPRSVQRFDPQKIDPTGELGKEFDAMREQAARDAAATAPPAGSEPPAPHPGSVEPGRVPPSEAPANATPRQELPATQTRAVDPLRSATTERIPGEGGTQAYHPDEFAQTQKWQPGQDPYAPPSPDPTPPWDSLPEDPNQTPGTRLPYSDYLNDPLDPAIDPVTGQPIPEGGVSGPQPATPPDAGPAPPTTPPVDPTPPWDKIPIDPNQTPGTRLPYQNYLNDPLDPPIDPATGKPLTE